jgi:hypothetical protein
MVLWQRGWRISNHAPTTSKGRFKLQTPLQLGQWTTKNPSSELLGLQSKFDVLQTQFHTLLTEHNKLKQKPPPGAGKTTEKPTGIPKPEENETRTIDGTKWYYCSNCWAGRRWNKTHRTAEHKRGVGKNRNLQQDQQQQESHMASYDTTYSGISDFQSG